MKIIRFITLLLMVTLVGGCFTVKKSAVVQNKAFYDPNEQARVRLFGPYGDKLIRPYSGRSCDDWVATAARRPHHRVVNGLPRRVRNVTAGIPNTKHSLAALEDSGFLMRDSFKEYVVEGDRPMVLDASKIVLGGVYNQYCRVAISFVPQAGKDYEAEYVERDRKCSIEIHEILNEASDSGISPTKPVSQIKGCMRYR